MLKNIIDKDYLFCEPIIEIKTRVGIKIINVLDIVYIKSIKNNTVVKLDNNYCIETIHSLKWFETALGKPLFFRCHNSFIVNCYYFYSILGFNILLGKKKNSIPISRNNIEQFKSNIKTLFMLNEEVILVRKSHSKVGKKRCNIATQHVSL